jgi:hypothetical protein
MVADARRGFGRSLHAGLAPRGEGKRGAVRHAVRRPDHESEGGRSLEREDVGGDSVFDLDATVRLRRWSAASRASMHTPPAGSAQGSASDTPRAPRSACTWGPWLSAPPSRAVAKAEGASGAAPAGAVAGAESAAEAEGASGAALAAACAGAALHHTSVHWSNPKPRQ